MRSRSSIAKQQMIQSISVVAWANSVSPTFGKRMQKNVSYLERTFVGCISTISQFKLYSLCELGNNPLHLTQIKFIGSTIDQKCNAISHNRMPKYRSQRRQPLRFKDMLAKPKVKSRDLEFRSNDAPRLVVELEDS